MALLAPANLGDRRGAGSPRARRAPAEGVTRERPVPGEAGETVCRQRSWRAAPRWVPREAEGRAKCRCRSGRQTNRWTLLLQWVPEEAPGLWGAQRRGESLRGLQAGFPVAVWLSSGAVRG